MIIASHQRTRSSTKTINNVMTVSPYNIQSREMGYQSRATFWPPNIPQTEITPKMLNTALPTMVPIPKSLLVTKVPIMFVKSSGALVPAKKKKRWEPWFFFFFSKNIHIFTCSHEGGSSYIIIQFEFLTNDFQNRHKEIITNGS